MKFRPTIAALVVVIAVTAAACGGDAQQTSSDDQPPATGSDAPSAQVSPGQEAASSQTAPSTAGPSEAPITAPALAPGGLATGQVVIDDTPIGYATVVPSGFEPGDTAPVMLAMPPGSQDFRLTQRIVEGVYMTEALARGWVIISPAAPNSTLYFQGSETLIPGFLEWIETWVVPEGGGPHLVGVSNGGISSFRIAAQDPNSIQSLLVFPGFARSDEDSAALASMVDLPVRLFVGADDVSWIPAMEEAHDILLNAGTDVTLEIFPGEGHWIESLSDGVRIFDELDALR